MKVTGVFLLLLFWLFISPVSHAGLPPGIVWERVDSRGGHQSNDFVAVNGDVVSVGNDGAVRRTSDRENWTGEKTGVTEHLLSIAEGNGVLVAVGNGGRILRSSTTGVWTVEVSRVTRSLESIAFGGGLFVAVGTNGTVVVSADGRKWDVWLSGITRNLHDVIWDGTRFLIVGDLATVLSAVPGASVVPVANTPSTFLNFNRITKGTNGYSVGPGYFTPDLESWTYLGEQSFNDLAAGSGRFVAACDAGVMAYSENGSQWTKVNTTTTENFKSVRWMGTEFIAITTTGRLAFSSDGYRWTMRSFFRSYTSGCWDGSRYVLVGAGGSIASSSDSIWWTSERTPRADDLQSVELGGGVLVAVGKNASIVSSSDGTNWQNRSPPCSWELWDVHWSGSSFWAVGENGLILSSANGVAWTIAAPGLMSAAMWDGARYLAFSGRNVIESADGNQWSAVSAISSIFEINDLIWTGSCYLAAGNSSTLVRSVDGVVWAQASFTGVPSAPSYRSLASSGTRVVAIADGYTAVSDNDGATWTRYAGFSGAKDVIWDGMRFLAAGLYGVYESSNGVSWQRIYNNSTQSFLSIAWDGTRYLAGGSTPSTSAGLVYSSLNGVVWTPVVSGSNTAFIDVEIGGGVGVAINSSGGIMRYSNGAWVSENSGLEANIKGLIRSTGGFLAFTKSATSSTSVQPGQWNQRNRRVRHSRLDSVTSGNGKLVAMGPSSLENESRVITSSDGLNWTNEVVPMNLTSGGNAWRGKWTGSQFVFLVGASVWTSASGTDWSTLGSAPGCYDLYDLEVFGGNIVLAGWTLSTGGSGIWNVVNGIILAGSVAESSVAALVSNNTQIIGLGGYRQVSSRDGFSWTTGEYVPGLSRSLNDVIYTPMGFFAVDGELWKSTNGRNWNKVAGIDRVTSNAMVYADNRLVAVGNGFGSSSDGEAWTYTYQVNRYLDVAWGNGRYVAVSSSDTASSIDGVAWQTVPQAFALDSVVWTGSEFLATNSNGAVAVSDDGLTWRFRVIPGVVTGYAFGGGIHVIGTSTGEIFRSLDGINWFRIVKAWTSALRVEFAGGQFFSIGSSTTFKSADGLTWTTTGRTLLDVAWTGSQYVGVGSGGAAYLSSDASAWSVKSTGTLATLRAVTWTGSQIIAVGNGGVAISSPDGIVWTTLNFSTTSSLADVVWDGTRTLALTSTGAVVSNEAVPTLPSGFLASALFSDGLATLAADGGGRLASLKTTGWQEGTRQTASPLTVISSAASGYVACGASGIIVQSTDGNIWSGAAGWNHLLGGAATSGEIFQAKSTTAGKIIGLGNLGSIVDSSGGRIWTLRTPKIAGATALNACLPTDGEIIAVGNAGMILRSDYENRSQSIRRTSLDLLAVAGSADRIVAVGKAGVILLSESGNNVPASYEQWIDAQGATPAERTPGGDSNRDGVGNLTAYLFGIPAIGSSTAADLVVLPQCVVGTENAQVLFELAPDRDDVELALQRTTNLSSWVEIARKTGAGSWGGIVRVIEAPGTIGRRQYSIAEPVGSGGPATFYRITTKLR